MGIGLGEDEGGDCLRVEGNVGASARANLEDAAGETGEELATPGDEARLLGLAHERVVDGGEEARHERYPRR